MKLNFPAFVLVFTSASVLAVLLGGGIGTACAALAYIYLKGNPLGVIVAMTVAFFVTLFVTSKMMDILLRNVE